MPLKLFTNNRIKYNKINYTLNLFFLVLIFGLYACSPVRTNLSKKEGDLVKDNKTKSTSNDKNKNKSDLLSDETKGIFDFENSKADNYDKNNNYINDDNSNNNSNNNNGLDTNVIINEPVKSNILFDNVDEFDFTPEFEKAVLEFDINFIEKACNKFDFFVSTLNPNDTLYFEALFYKSECLISKMEFDEAEKILSKLIRNRKIPEAVLQKSYIRIGHIYCATNRNDLSELAFNQFKEKFPKSKLTKLANCESIKNIKNKK